MNNVDNKILKFISKVSFKLRINNIINEIVRAILIALLLDAALLLISIFITIKYAIEICIGILILSLIVGIFLGLLRRISKVWAALTIDSKGLQERVVTSLGFIGDNSDIAMIQKRDTLDTLKDFNINKNLMIIYPKKEIKKCFAMLLVCIVIFCIPSPAKKQANNYREFKKEQNVIIEKIKKEEKKVEEKKYLEDDQRKRLLETLKNTQEEIKDLEEKKDIKKVMERLEKKFENIKQDTKSEEIKKNVDDAKKNILEEEKLKNIAKALEDLNKINDELKNSKQGQEILDSMKAGNSEDIKKKLQSINDSLENLSETEKSKLANALASASANLSDEELKNLLKDASKGVLDGNIANIDDISKLLANMKNSTNTVQKNNNNTLQDGIPVQANGNGSGNGNGGVKASGKASRNGDGYNVGSLNGIEEISTPKVGEEVFVQGRNVGNDSNLSGKKNDSGNSQSFETQSGLNIDGNKVQYDSVVGDYSQTEMESMENSGIPENLQEIVKNYFSELE